MTAHTPPPSALEILQNLIRFDTTNPPGNEGELIGYLRGLLETAGIQNQLVARSPQRPNLIARLPGAGQAPPLLLYGHTDVVTTVGQSWRYPPFEGCIEEGFIWGRGALDMKGELAMLLAAFLRARAEGITLPGDVIFLAVVDEEAGGEFGAKFLVEQHPHMFSQVRYALSEFGGFNMSMAGVRFYPIMIAEKQICTIQVTFHGPAGHAAMPIRGGAMARLSRALQALDEALLPVHITPPVRLMIEHIADNLSGLSGRALRLLLQPALTDLTLRSLGKRLNYFSPLLRHTASPTMLQASSQINVIPGEIRLGIDGRLLPTRAPDELVSELRSVLGPDADLQVVRSEPCPASLDMGLFDVLAASLRQLDPRGIPIPFVLPQVTDARFFSQLGIQTYGFVPLQLPDDFDFISTVHAADERVPIAALDFGAQAIYQVLGQFHQTAPH
jgi:acetylornithine deacetylase/succinyl-diaminopimelate desuccinylase-like protein